MLSGRFFEQWSLNILWQADPDTDEVYARMTLQPVSNVGHTSLSPIISSVL